MASSRRHTKKRHHKSVSLMLIVVVSLTLIVGFEIVSVYQRLGDARAQEATLCAQLERQRQENAALRSDLEHAGDSDFWKKLARQNDLYEDGTRIFYDVNN